MAQDGLFHDDAAERAVSARGPFVRVAVERGVDDAEGLTYGWPFDAGPPPTVGERVEVPLGRKATAGIVVASGGPELLGGLAASRVRPVARRVGAALPPALVELARWMAGYYVAPLGMVLAGMMPAAVKHDAGRRVVEMVDPPSRGTAGARPDGMTARRLSLWNAVLAVPDAEFPMPLRSLARRVGTTSLAGLRSLAGLGLIVVKTTTQIAPPRSAGGGAIARAAVVTPTPEQQGVIDGITAAGLDAFRVHLLRGVTGSGKTEVYLRLIDAVLRGGRSAIVLVPEIALTPQTSERFTSRLGPGRVAVLHSGMSASQRNREWARVSEGEATVVVGARSALFAPVASLGLIVVDEEHDGSYKQDRVPRYNARDTAIKRAQLAGCPVLLGSATPSLESWANATRAPGPANPWRLWTLASRVPGATLPEVRVLDMAEERRLRLRRDADDPHAASRLRLLGPTLEDAIARTLDGGAQRGATGGAGGGAGGQVILLLNRRGFAHYICCPSPACGFVLSCDQCDATLVLHKDAGVPAGTIVRCHHCLAEQLVPTLCPTCARKLNVFGGGTQRLEAEVERSFASMGIRLGETMLRLDSDAMRTARDYHDALARFGRGEVRVLVGTQMIAKGLDFPNVGLVGVIDADTALSIPDFRAQERTFQLVSQVAGRAGRGGDAGLVLIQTLKPRDRAIGLAASHDYTTFAEGELRTRRQAALPPATRMARVVCRDGHPAKARAAAQRLADALRGVIARDEPVNRGTRVVGPLPCAISRIAAQYRFSVDLHAANAGAVQRALAAVRAEGGLTSDARTAVDVDPIALL